ncbi:EF-P beta-lysylation protein EpmB [Alcanivorax sp. JB21]|nr:EF-P beta-lysylation protein EpmB [Alcanivorax limicola]MBZ2190268.1 EF-P beta-lysylation protein EpmB [Alcanivorax limicola]
MTPPGQHQGSARIPVQDAADTDWQQAQADVITDPGELLGLLGLDTADLPAALRAAADFPLRVPRAYAARMQPGDAQDPLLRQVLTSPEELAPTPGYDTDPLAEAAHTPVPGILHKYHGRVLLVVTGACAVHCRYCFRRHFPYQSHLPTAARLDEALSWLNEHTEIEEVILSGGDPFSLSDRRLLDLLARLATIPHLRRLRIHSRLPVVIPGRITPALVAALGDARWQSVLVLHANHAHELTPGLAAEVRALQQLGVTVLNQAVLLRGVNDTLPAQEALSLALFQHGILPYYLHQLDRVAGAAHFSVSDDQARALHRALRHRLPGYLVPRLVREVAGDLSKTPL